MCRDIRNRVYNYLAILQYTSIGGAKYRSKYKHIQWKRLANIVIFISYKVELLYTSEQKAYF